MAITSDWLFTTNVIASGIWAFNLNFMEHKFHWLVDDMKTSIPSHFT